nr:GDSL-type esterase/lipase family protein [Neobacillus sp. Marseille-Q6967]
MKIVKYLLVFVLVIGLGISAWIYYPQYQVYKLKQQAAQGDSDSNKVSYIDYFRNSDEDHIYHLAIGDSIIRGYGANQNEDLVYQFSNKLEAQIGKPIQFQNEGMNGITSGELKALILEGRFDMEIKQSDIITINVGGNDILQMGMDQNFNSIFQTFNDLQSNFSKNLSAITNRIEMLNPNATIVLLELYNPLSPENQFYPLADQLLPNWNLKIYEIAKDHSSSIVVETTQVINGENLQNLSSDGVHPNSAGYAAISEQMILQFKNQYKKESA